jgi:hypothetical protein
VCNQHVQHCQTSYKVLGSLDVLEAPSTASLSLPSPTLHQYVCLHSYMSQTPQSQLVELMQTQNQCILCQLLQICTFGWQLRDPKCALLKSCGLGWPLSACTGEFKHSGYANVAQSFKRKSHKSDLWLQH